jgi:hypothetical protein
MLAHVSSLQMSPGPEGSGKLRESGQTQMSDEQSPPG